VTAAVHVFVGPSLPPAARPVDGVVYHPPVRHGDLFALDPAPGDRILIVDGVYQQDAPIRHKEIIAMLRRGVAVFGAASLGALRAAELEAYGMVGLGRVFAAYRSGELDADADVAVLQADAEHHHRALTVAQVTVRFGVRALVAAGAVTPEDGARLIDASAALHFTERNPAALQAAANSAGLFEAAAALLRSVAGDGDVKRADAVAAIRAVSDGEVVSGCGAAAAGAVAVSSYEAEWALEETPFAAGGPTRAEVLTFAQLAVPDYPERHRRRVRRVVARASGLAADSPATDLLAGAGMYCTRVSEPAAEQILVRSFRVAPGRLVVVDLPDEALEGLDVDELVDDCRTLLELSGDVAARVACAPHWRIWPDTAVDTELRHAWKTGPGEEELELAAVDRGFRDLDEARRRARRFTPGLWWLRTQVDAEAAS